MLVFTHLCDRKVPKLRVKPEGKFICFLDKFQNSNDASISYIVEDSDDRLSVQTYSYKNSFEKKDFLDLDKNWNLNTRSLCDKVTPR